MRGTDIRIVDASFQYEDFHYRSPIKFGGVALDKATVLNATVTVETRSGKRAIGLGSMPLGNIWAWPSKRLNYDQTLAAMKELASAFRQTTAEFHEFGHPIELGHSLEERFLGHRFPVAAKLQLGEEIPVLAALVAASPFDAAIHDAYGKSLGLNCFHVYGPEYLEGDLARYLGPEFAGETLDRYVSREPKPRMPLYHLVGALDPLSPADVKKPVGDGLPEHLGQWIHRDGLTHLKIKLNGDDLAWDVERVLAVNRVAEEAQQQRGIAAWWYSLDFNERCQNVLYLLDFLRRLRDQSHASFDRVQYIEQPTARDLKADRQNAMHEAAKFKPVVIDESLIDLESLQLAREMGYTGVAFKACKGQTQTLLLAAAAQKYGLFRCVQDLTCIGASLIHSASIAAHIPGVAAIESNGRQYCPIANAPWESHFPGVFTIRDGTMNTSLLNGPGLGTE
ncbi:MAG TPA: mandelate racemase/muconate lactonizing enzyme family protein [Gemmataceae bacterium]|jgi:L-alanine-DL-glutamate epimerase-like enolase superfamily enzyme